jgi:hypothetical protein
MVAVIFRGEIAAVQHQKLPECALARDFTAARKILVEHIQGCVEHALARDTDWVTVSAPRRPSEAAMSTRRRASNKASGRVARPGTKQTSSA